jgi:hypothetical protein
MLSGSVNNDSGFQQADHEGVGNHRHDTERAQDVFGEVAGVEGHDDIRHAGQRSSEDVSVIWVWKR